MIATFVLSTSMLFAQSLHRASGTDAGYDAEQITVVQLARAAEDRAAGPAAVTEYRRMIGERLRALGPVRSVGFGGVVPAIRPPDTYAIEAVGGAAQGIASEVGRVAASWIDTLEIPLLAYFRRR